MIQHIAFLRGINVGGHRVKMDRLREFFEELGLANVATFIASGNVIFSDSGDVDALTDKIEKHLAQRLGYDVATFLRSPAQLDEIVARSSLPDGEPEPSVSIYVIFLREPAPRTLRSTFASLASEMDEFRFSGAEIYWRIQGKLSESPLFGNGLERALRGVDTTTRNMNTVRRLVAKTRQVGKAGAVD